MAVYLKKLQQYSLITYLSTITDYMAFFLYTICEVYAVSFV